MKKVKKHWRYIKNFVRGTPRVLKYKFFKIIPPDDQIGKIKDITLEDSSAYIKKKLVSNEPFAMVRFGGSEISALNNYEKIKLGFKNGYKKKVKYAMKNNAGFFPATDEQLNFYGDYMKKALMDTDTLAISGLHMENYFFEMYTPLATPIQNWALDPLLGGWSPLLKGKRVLVISPFAKDIESQYQKRELLFPNSEILPEFTLTTIEAVQTSGDALDSRYQTWFDALDAMKMEIHTKDFDVALVGAGAYGTPLCLFIKSLGKQALQSGGATQLLFGIIGKRWEEREPIKSYLNEHWIRPSVQPEGYKNIEKGCYW